MRPWTARRSYSGGKRETLEGRLGSETPALPWAGLLLVLLAASAVGVELLVKGLPANHSLYGDAKARWTINEYADLECPFCKVYQKSERFVRHKDKCKWSYSKKRAPANIKNALELGTNEAARAEY